MRALPQLPLPTPPIADRVWYGFLSVLRAVLGERLPVVGSATFAAATTVTVTFTKPEASAAYQVFLAPRNNLTFWVTGRTTTGFTINASAVTSATIGWALLRD